MFPADYLVILPVELNWLTISSAVFWMGEPAWLDLSMNYVNLKSTELLLLLALNSACVISAHKNYHQTLTKLQACILIDAFGNYDSFKH